MWHIWLKDIIEALKDMTVSKLVASFLVLDKLFAWTVSFSEEFLKE